MTSAFSVVVTGQSLITHDIRDIRDEKFREVVQFLRRGDVAFTNFESTIMGRHGGWPTKGRYFGYSIPEVLDALKDIGFNTLALANNHAFDLGPNGVLSTLEEVAKRGFLHAGIGVDRRDAAALGRQQVGCRAVSLLAVDAGPGPSNMYAEDASELRPSRPGVNGLKTLRKLGAPAGHFEHLSTLMEALQSSPLERANYAQPEDPPLLGQGNDLDLYGTVFSKAENWRRIVEVDRESAEFHLAAIRNAAALGDFVIAYLHHHHWEPNWQEVPLWVQEFAHACVDAGANLFVSHGTPVLQALEVYNEAPIFYGLGNFIFHTAAGEEEWSPPEVWQSVVATCQYDPFGRLEGIELLPIVIGSEAGGATMVECGLVPRAASGNSAERVLSQFKRRSKAFGVDVEVDGTFGRVHVPMHADGGNLAPSW